MNAPKLLYHGTAMMSVWASYQHWQALGKLRRKKPQLFKRHLKGDKALGYYQRFGPFYPTPNRNDKRQVVLSCLTGSFSCAWSYAIGWTAAFNPEVPQIIFEGHNRFNLTAASDFTPAINKFVFEFGDQKGSFHTPGAIMLFDGHFLRDAGLLAAPRGDEDFIPRCLPWRALRGVLLLSAGRRGMINSYIFEGRQVLDDLMEDLEKDAGLSRIFDERLWHKFTAGRSTVTGQLDIFKIEG